MSDSPAITLDTRLGAEHRPPAPTGSLTVVRRFLRSSVLGTASLILLLVVAVAAIGAEQLTSYDPVDTDFAALKQGPSSEHVLGTDTLGRDVLSRLIYGARVTLIVGISSVLLGDGIGFFWGLISGYMGGKVDD